MSIRLSKTDLSEAVANNVITPEQSDNLWNFLEDLNKDKPRFTGNTIVYYIGALLIISAMTWLATESFAQFRALGLIFVSIAYFIGFWLTGSMLHKKEGTRIPGGLLLTVSVFMVPLLIFAVQKHLNLWVFENPGNYTDYYVWIKSGWFFMEAGTILTSLAFLFVYRFPFLTFPLAFTLWFLSMDLTPVFFGPHFRFDDRLTISVVVGLVMILIAYFTDRRTKEDYSFWLYLFGLLAFWGGLSCMDANSELSRFFYFLINVSLMVISALFRRKVFMVFGVMGAFGYLVHLADEVFKDSFLFPIALSSIGAAIIVSGLAYSKNKKSIELFIDTTIPDELKNILPTYR